MIVVVIVEKGVIQMNKELKKDFIKDNFPKTENDRLWEKIQKLEKEFKDLQKEFIEKEKQLEYANKVWRKYIPAFPSQIKSKNAVAILESISNEKKEDLEKFIGKLKGFIDKYGSSALTFEDIDKFAEDQN